MQIEAHKNILTETFSELNDFPKTQDCSSGKHKFQGYDCFSPSRLENETPIESNSACSRGKQDEELIQQEYNAEEASNSIFLLKLKNL